MAINPNILLQGIVPDVVGSAGRGFQLGQSIKQAPLRNQLLEQQAQQGGQAIASNEQALNAGVAAEGQRLAVGVNSVLGDMTADQITPEIYAQTVAVLDEMGTPVDDQYRAYSPENAAFAANISQAGKKSLQQRGGGQTGFQTNAPIITEKEGQKFFTSLQSDRATGEQRVTNIPIDGEVANRLGLTTGQSIDADAARVLAEENAKAEAEKLAASDRAAAAAEEARLVKQSEFQQATSVEAFKASSAIENQISKVDKGIEALEKGAESGIVSRNIPSFKAATVQLEEAAKELGIEVINSATFGALSEKELGLALDTALPLNLDEEELLPYLREKRAAMVKLRDQMDEMGTFLSEEGNSVADWRKMQKDIRDAREGGADSPQLKNIDDMTEEEIDAELGL